MTAGAAAPLHLALDGATKRFGDVVALDAVDLDLRPGRVHALLGGNGAGKTTCSRLLAGLLEPDAGRVLRDGAPVRFRSRRQAVAAGVAFVQQELSLVRGQTGAENALLGHPATGWLPDRAAAARAIREVAGHLDVDLDPHVAVERLSMGQRQLLEIVIGLSWGARLLILDEPTAATGAAGLRSLRRVLPRLRADGVAVLYITHKLPEVAELAQDVTVMREGAVVATARVGDVPADELAAAMVGEVLAAPSRSAPEPGDVVLRLAGVRSAPLRDVDLCVRAGEVVGVAGVVGNGQEELVRVAGGLRRPAGGTVDIAAPSVGVVPEDRDAEALALALPLTDNAILRAHRDAPCSRRGFLRRTGALAHTRRVLDDLGVRFGSERQAAGSLSGGNQQRLVLGRELLAARGLVVLHNPTRGLDIGASLEVHRRILALADAGTAVLLVSPDLDELLTVSDRVQVLYEGRLSAPVAAAGADVAHLAALMAGAA